MNALFNKRNQAGDTLVSVAISIVALGVTMTIAYVIVSRAFDSGQQARERQQVLQQVQSQGEILKFHVLHSNQSEDDSRCPKVSDSGNVISNSGGKFLDCIQTNTLIDGSNKSTSNKRSANELFCFETDDSGGTVKTRFVLINSSNYDKCYISNDIYYEDLKIDIEYIKNPPGDDGDEYLYIIRARWNDDQDKLQSQIRLDPDLANLEPVEIRPITP